MISGDIRDDELLLFCPAVKTMFENELHRILMMRFGALRPADIMQQSGRFKPLPLTISKTVQFSQAIEQLQRQSSHLRGMSGFFFIPEKKGINRILSFYLFCHKSF